LGHFAQLLARVRVAGAARANAKAIMNPATALKVKDVPHLRIIDDEHREDWLLAPETCKSTCS
jgi:hypothetical protein